MTTDYKHKLGKHSRPRPLPGWVWLLSGLGIGLMVASVVYLRLTMPVAEPVETELPVQQEKDVVPESGGPDVRETVRPRFEFYTILRDMEVVVPEGEITGPSHRGVRKVEEHGTYLLQVGSFRSVDQADRLKARLVLLGLDVSIKSVDMGQNGTWHRVVAGPYDDLDQLNSTRLRLREHQIDTILLKVKQ